MKVNAQDIAGFGVHALIGGILAGLYSVASLYCERQAGALLCIPTSHLHLDRSVLLSCCRELEKRTKERNIGYVEYLQIIHIIDQIVALRFRLAELHDQKQKGNTRGSCSVFSQFGKTTLDHKRSSYDL